MTDELTGRIVTNTADSLDEYRTMDGDVDYHDLDGYDAPWDCVIEADTESQWIKYQGPTVEVAP
jgi:hypothetical protein